MQGRPRKTCWSVVSSTLSHVTPTKLFLFCMWASAQAMGNTATTEVIPFTFRNGNGKFGDDWNKNDCVQAAPDCLLEVTSKTSDTHENFEIDQLCSSFPDRSLTDQQRSGHFLGKTFCKGTLTNRKINEDGSITESKVDWNTPKDLYLAKETRLFASGKSPSPKEAPKCPEVPKYQPFIQMFRNNQLVGESSHEVSSDSIHSISNHYVCRLVK